MSQEVNGVTQIADEEIITRVFYTKQGHKVTIRRKPFTEAQLTALARWIANYDPNLTRNKTKRSADNTPPVF